MKIGFIGAGMMGGSLLKAVAAQISSTAGENVAQSLCFSEAFKARREQISAETGAAALDSNVELARACDIIFLAVKPQQLSAVLREIAPYVEGKIVASIAAGVSLAALREGLGSANIRDPASSDGSCRIVRLMPNLPATVGAAMIALCSADQAAADSIAALLAKAGRVEQVPESLMDCVTGVSGSGPAYGFIFIEALADAAVLMGMPRAQAYVYAAQTLKGAAEMVLQSGTHPAALKDAVCSPGGTTIEAVRVLEDRGFRAAIIAAAKAAADKFKT
jgi:pyrroline-5-carboxylate reductase